MGKSNARAAPAQAITATAALTEHATAIRQLGKRVAADVIEIGRRLVECRDRHLEHGQWLPWLEKEFGWSDRTARNFINVFEQSKSEKFSNLNLPVSSLYLLAAPSTPKKARKEIAKLAKGGKKIKHDTVRTVVKKHKAAKKAAAKKPKANALISAAGMGKQFAALDKRAGDQPTVIEAGNKTEPTTAAAPDAPANTDAVETKPTYRELEIQIEGLKSEIEELKIARTVPALITLLAEQLRYVPVPERVKAVQALVDQAGIKDCAVISHAKNDVVIDHKETEEPTTEQSSTETPPSNPTNGWKIKTKKYVKGYAWFASQGNRSLSYNPADALLATEDEAQAAAKAAIEKEVTK
jgi:DUF3102 family protein